MPDPATPERIRARLEAAFTPTRLVLRDDSAQHQGHAGAQAGGGHYHLEIEAACFAGLAGLACHRKIYAALGDLMQREIHALSIQVRTGKHTA